MWIIPSNLDKQYSALVPGSAVSKEESKTLVHLIKVASYVEIEAFIIWNLLSLMEKGLLAPAPFWADCKTFPYRYFRNKIHGITAGYPCQPFSIAGLRKGANDPRHLWPHIFRIFQSVRPFWGFFENVAEHLNTGYEQVSRDLRKAGYLVEEGLFSAEEVGAPHERKRLFILAVKMEYAQCLRQTGPESSKLANTNNHGHRAGAQSITEKSQTPEASPRKQNGQRVRNEFGDESKNVSYTINSRQQEQWNTPLLTAQNSYYGSTGKWPLGPGPQQHSWEAPRTIKSGMGSTVNGYNFREDLLRMLGNAVVEQTAELAWQTLWSKHLTKI